MSAPNAPITVLVVDDERPARDGMRSLLATQPDVTVIGEAASGKTAIAAIEQLRPDLVFLDVQMPDGGGFDVISAVGVEHMPAVIFATAFDEYAMQAFDAHAADYLLKPIERERFEAALGRARARVRQTKVDDRLARLIDALTERTRWRQRFNVKVGNRTQFVPVSQVDYFESEANYVRIHAAGRSWLIRDSLGSVADQLDPSKFVRVHRSLLLNLARVQEVESLPAGEYILHLTTGKRLTSGRTYRTAVQTALGL